MGVEVIVNIISPNAPERFASAVKEDKKKREKESDSTTFSCQHPRGGQGKH